MSKHKSNYTLNGKKHIIKSFFFYFQIARIEIKGQEGLTLTLYETERHICILLYLLQNEYACNQTHSF